MQAVLDGRLGLVLREIWETEQLRVRPQVDLLRALLRANVEGAAEAGLAAVGTELIASDPERARGLAVALLGSGGGNTWTHLWPFLTEHPDWGITVGGGAVAPTGYYALFLHDPDGIKIEIMSRPRLRTLLWALRPSTTPFRRVNRGRPR